MIPLAASGGGPPRALVVRSGALDFPRPLDPAALEVFEKITHGIEPLAADPAVLTEPAALAIFTSQVAVRVFFDDPGRQRLFGQALSAGRVAAVGESTAAALRDFGVEPSIVAAGSGASVLDRLPRRLDGWRVLLPRGEDATLELPEGLASRGARLRPMVLYRKVPAAADPALDTEIAGGAFFALATTSPAAASWLFTNASPAAMDRLREMPAVVLGRYTGRYLNSRGIERVETAEQPTFHAILARLAELAAARPTA
ncbi:MAG: uroporphyrinogen-III synthase [Thermoanaerobaculia bacterium]|nr:uroporphyrinogen-III synthase [Acidobacteriota bacterium]